MFSDETCESQFRNNGLISTESAQNNKTDRKWEYHIIPFFKLKYFGSKS